MEIKAPQEASLSFSLLEEWQHGPQVLNCGAILICRAGRAVLRVNYKDWEMFEGAVITVFPNDVVEIVSEELRTKDEESNTDFQVEILKYSPSLLREASLQLEQTVYSSLREDRCRQNTSIVTRIIDSMFGITCKTVWIKHRFS